MCFDLRSAKVVGDLCCVRYSSAAPEELECGGGDGPEVLEELEVVWFWEGDDFGLGFCFGIRFCFGFCFGFGLGLSGWGGDEEARII